jgi:hypothetical protein
MKLCHELCFSEELIEGSCGWCVVRCASLFYVSITGNERLAGCLLRKEKLSTLLDVLISGVVVHCRVLPSIE